MTIPDPPTSQIEFLSEVNGNSYDSDSNPDGLADGGHRQNWAPAMNAVAVVANWISSVIAWMSATASQVAADAASAAAGSGTEATVANIRAGLSAWYLSIRRIYAANEFVALTDSATIDWDMASGINFAVTLGAAGRTLANPSNQVAGKSGLIIVTQDATGGRSITTYGNQIVWYGPQPDWPSTPGAETLIAYVVKANGQVRLSAGGSSAS